MKRLVYCTTCFPEPMLSRLAVHIHIMGSMSARDASVHYRSAVEEVTVEQFTDGRPLWVGCEHQQGFTREEVVRRARSRIGERRYRLLTNNCEHFCAWCLWGEHRSPQVDEWISPFVRALQTSRGEPRRNDPDGSEERRSGAAECA